MQREVWELFADNKPLPKGTRIKTTNGGVYTGGTHELTDDQLAAANRLPNIFSGYVPFWILGWKDLHDDLIVPPAPKRRADVTTKTFALGDVLSVTTARLVSPRHMDGLYDILNWMTGDDLYTHQIPRAMRECAPFLLKQFPQLAAINAEAVTPENWAAWLHEQVLEHGNEFAVAKLPEHAHEFIDPLSELAEKVHPDKIIVVDPSSAQSTKDAS